MSMNNCLVKELKSDISGNASYFNKLRIIGNASDAEIRVQGDIRITSDTITKVLDVNNVEIELPYSVNTGTSTLRIHAKSGDTLDVYIEKEPTFLRGVKCTLQGDYMALLQFPTLTSVAWTASDFDVKFLKENQSVKTLNIEDAYSVGDVANLKDTGVTSITAGQSRCHGDIANLANEDVTYISMGASHSLYGSIENFGECLSLTDLYFSNSPDVYGDIDSLAQAQYNNGRQSGTLKVLASNTECTNSYEGGTLRVNITFSAGGYSMANV